MHPLQSKIVETAKREAEFWHKYDRMRAIKLRKLLHKCGRNKLKTLNNEETLPSLQTDSEVF